MATTMAAPARADTAAPGGAALRQARAAWDRRSLDGAEPLYREALEKGGLAPAEVLEGYVRLGSIRAARGKKDQAVAAFRAASILVWGFTVPPEAGPRGRRWAAQAKHDTAKIGSIELAIKAPREVVSGKPFTVAAQLDTAHVAIVAKIGLVARDGTSGKEVTAEAAPGEQVDLEVPAEITLPSASLLVRVDALDAHGNRLASAEERVRIPDSGAAVVVAAPLGPPPATMPTEAPPAKDDSDRRKGGGFWASPWPYVIGGVAIASAGTAVYFGTRPSDQVSVGQVGVKAK